MISKVFLPFDYIQYTFCLPMLKFYNPAFLQEPFKEIINLSTYKKVEPKISHNIFEILSVMFGIEGIEIYFPKTYVDQVEYGISTLRLEKFKGVSAGKYTKGLGQLQLSFTGESEDVNSMSLTVVRNLMNTYNIHPSQVGRLEIGTQTLLDKSKSTKTVLMTLFQGYHDIEGATSLNACYGGTNALINTLNWISSPSWDGRYGIVVAADSAVYEDGPARCTGGAGAVALLIGPNGKIIFNRERSSYIDHAYDFYKPIPSSEYPTVDGKLSVQCYLKAIENCYLKLKEKTKGQNIIAKNDFCCFHSPFYKMVQKAFLKATKVQNSNITDKDALEIFQKKVHPSLYISQRIGNIYTGSLFSCLISVLIQNPKIKNKNIMLFSYGSGLCATMMTAKVISNPLGEGQIQAIFDRLANRIKVDPEQYTKIMLERENNFGKFRGSIPLNEQLIEDDVFYLTKIDEKWRRFYHIKKSSKVELKKNIVSSMIRLQNLNKQLTNTSNLSKFYKLPIKDRLDVVSSHAGQELDYETLRTGGLNMDLADSMIENVVGILSLPLSIVPTFVINKKKHMIPMCIEEPSVVAACSSIGKLLSSHSFFTSSTPNVMLGQVFLPNSSLSEMHQIMGEKQHIIASLNKFCENMVKRGGGVMDLRARELNPPYSTKYSIDIFINVCEAMGANITNTICERTKQYISNMGIKTGIAILSNYCLERKALSTFQIPVNDLDWKGVKGSQVAEKIVQAYQFAKADRYRAVTHNKGIMNGIDAVCVATGQDWRAVESAAHSYASRTQNYLPLSHYEIIQRGDQEYLRGTLQLPIAVGSKGGVIQKNPIYKSTMEILKNPSAQQLSEILVSIGLAQNFGALRALAVEGIQKGHMMLHARSVAQKAGVPKELIDIVCREMTLKKKYDVEEAKKIMVDIHRSRL